MLRVCAILFGILVLFSACGTSPDSRTDRDGGNVFDPTEFDGTRRSVDPKLAEVLRQDPDWVGPSAENEARPETPAIELPENQREEFSNNLQNATEEDPLLTTQEPGATAPVAREVTLRNLIRTMQEEVGTDPDNIDLWHQLAMLHIISGDQREARRILDKVGKGGGQLLNLMSAYNHEQLGMNADAIEELRATLGWLDNAMPLEIVDLTFALKTGDNGVELRATPNELIPGELIVLYAESKNYSKGADGQVAGLTATPQLFDPQGIEITPAVGQGWLRDNPAAYLVQNRAGRVFHVWVLVWPKNLRAGLVKLSVTVNDVSGKRAVESLTFAVRGN